MADAKPPIDWPAIEADYRAGTMPIREMARWYSISESTIRTRAKVGKWVRTSAQASAHPARVAEARPQTLRTPLTLVTTDPKAIVGRGRNLVLRLLDELDTVTTCPGELEEMIERETAADENPRRREAMMKAISLPSRANTVKALALAYKTLADAGAPLGKKEAAAGAAETAGEGTGWGDDLGPAGLPN